MVCDAVTGGLLWFSGLAVTMVGLGSFLRGLTALTPARAIFPRGLEQHATKWQHNAH